MNRNKFLIRSFALIAVLVISAFSGIVVFQVNASHEVEASDLTKLDAADISAFRWIAMAEFYVAHSKLSELMETASVDLTALNAADISAYRWNAMSKFYAPQNESQEAQAHFMPPGR